MGLSISRFNWNAAVHIEIFQTAYGMIDRRLATRSDRNVLKSILKRCQVVNRGNPPFSYGGNPLHHLRGFEFPDASMAEMMPAEQQKREKEWVGKGEQKEFWANGRGFVAEVTGFDAMPNCRSHIPQTEFL